MTAPDPPVISALTTAQLFHGHYERLAANFDYKTRPESAVGWSNVPTANRLLMIAAARAVLTDLGFEVTE